MPNNKPNIDEDIQQESSFEKLSDLSIEKQTIVFHPVLYHFRTSPTQNRGNKYALQLPFALLFDNLITVLWAIYRKNPKVMCGINQVQWAIEFLKTMKDDYNCPESIRKIIKDFEKYLIVAYAKAGEIIHGRKTKQEENERENFMKAIKDDIPVSCISYNEEDIMEKLNKINIPMDIVTGEAKALRDLNSLGRRKNKTSDTCKIENKSSKTYVIGALQKLLTVPSHETKSKVEELIKGLKI